MPLVHVVGAGLAGLACALRLAEAGHEVALYEAAAHAGGRCRSYDDASLGRTVDNGSHLLLSAYHATRAYVAAIGAADALAETRPAALPFLDLATGERWTIRPGKGPLPLWLLSPARRIPGTRLGEYMQALALKRAGPNDTVADCVDPNSVLFQRLWQPLSRGALNTDATQASARLLWRVLAETLLKGEATSRPLVIVRPLSEALVRPAVATLARRGVQIRFRARLRGIGWTDNRVTSLIFPEGALRVTRTDSVVLAVPPEPSAEIWPAIRTPTQSRAIVNAHFRMPEPVALPGGTRFLGLVGGTAQWLFARGDVVSVTVSAADRLLAEPNWKLANLFWSEIAGALGRNIGRLPSWRVVKERRATIAQTPAQCRLRPGPETPFDNLFLAGDWTDTGLPATIEGAIRSGNRAADLVLRLAPAEKGAREPRRGHAIAR